MAKDNLHAVLRQPVMGAATRRLPGLNPAPAPIEHEAIVKPDPNVLRNQLREQFADELLQLQNEARQRGLSSAQQQWQEESKKLRQEITDEKARLSVVIDGLKQAQAELLQTMEPVVGRLALLATIRLLGQHQQLRPLVADVVTQTLDAYRLDNPLRIHLSTVDYEQIKSSELHMSLLQYLVADASLASGDCLIEHGSGRLEAGLDIQWDALKKALMSTQGVAHVAEN
ncbi:MAG: FliH/SctL family protein [Moraxellaceae bacterium]|nr:FliH/SctL family protein [Moraxellaceae bacterium]MDZ4385682.1 FliH/SctL family protein [Moraxellaceae bacterium]